ncbi:hypothetical protein A3C57_00775 [Candidatus Nomurabacteria bacterium RIFCSPHIGHO2_02_FULL_33_12]|uniref:Uncharacterized protein n=1 Tax=Candidatus Nomurabacteria bacterium RIFCSPLOWO2_01_FULL_33_17 TaxID=1801764 RepID=A0A1F6WQW6_9BACT|nr:MAG: hypothetical protein A3C57_00775 [Candidatus Nomurabacteria bacterium RIFCSPHIGHO2_02_FULL_33_12]OGI84267.1 MAG: hypothetical protein A2903_00115 [Candidatus Nomurabacteria bacterium RIFCSPLOWO2_01_FULL_33_17]
MENNNEETLKSVIQEDINNSSGVPRFEEKNGEFHVRNSSDYSASVSTKLGLKILLPILAIGIIVMLAYTFLFS